MTRLPTVLLTSLVLLAGVAPATAAPIGVLARLRIEIQGLAPVTLASSGVIDVSGGIYTLPGGLLSVAGLTVPVTTTSAIASLVASNVSNLPGSAAPGGVTAQIPSEICAVPANGEGCVSGGGIGGIVAVAGTINVHVVPHVVVIPIELLDLRLGQGGATAQPYTIDAAPWTTGIVRIGGVVFTPSSGVGNLSVSGSSSTGQLALVSGAFLAACGNLLPVTARLTLAPLVPEPATVLALVSGAAGLLTLARRWG